MALTPQARRADLLKRLSLEEASGLLVHGSLQDAGFYRQPGAPIAPDEKAAYNLDRARQWILSQHVSSFVTRLNGGPEEMASANNRIQEIAESSPFGIPVTISCDPKRHHLTLMLESGERDRAFSLWPEPLGFAAIGDPELTRRFATRPAQAENRTFSRRGNLSRNINRMRYILRVKIGYARVSTEDQKLALQLEVLKDAGCQKVFREKLSGAYRERPELNRMLDQLREGDTVTV